MSGEFVMSFLQTCWEEGLSKEAAAELLQRQSVIHTGEQSPAWLEGYEKVASMAPGGLLPLMRDGYLEKSGGGRTLHALGDLAGGIKDLAVAGGRKLSSGVGSLVGKPKLNRKGVMTPSLVNRHPKSSLAAGIGLSGAAVYGGSKLLSGGPSGDGTYVPSMPSGSYNPDESRKRLDSLVEDDSRGVYDHNKKFFNEEGRRRELADAVARNDFNSGAAQTELSKMEADRASTSALRKQKFAELDTQANASAEKVKELNGYREKMEDHKKSWLYAPYRGYLKLTGRDPDTVYNDEIARAATEAGDVNSENYRINEMRRKMSDGITSGSAAARSPQQMQNDFFPSYN